MGMVFTGGMTLTGGMSALAGGGAPPPASGFTFDPTKKNASIILSNGNLTSEFTTNATLAAGIALTTGSPKGPVAFGSSAEKYVFEFSITDTSVNNGGSYFAGYGRVDGNVSPQPGPNYDDSNYMISGTYYIRFAKDGSDFGIRVVGEYQGAAPITTICSERLAVVFEIQPKTSSGATQSNSYVSFYRNGVQYGSTIGPIPVTDSSLYSPYAGFYYTNGTGAITVYPTVDSMQYFNSYPVGSQAWPA